jgi:hypothetical protein
MTQVIESTHPAPTTAPEAGLDLPAAIHRVLASSPEPLTPSKIRAALPASCRPENLDELTECLRRQVAANVLYQYPKYRSQQDRFWDRAMPTHIAALLREVLQEKPLPWSELRRKLPAYAVAQAEAVLHEQVAQGLLYRHPPAGKRGGERFGARPPDPRDYLREELSQAFHRLEALGFSRTQLREGAIELLHEEEWEPATTTSEAGSPATTETPSTMTAEPASPSREPESVSSTNLP